MSSWQDDAITKVPKKEVQRDSWWTRPAVQGNRDAFQRQLVDGEIARMNGDPQFGRSRTTNDKFPQAKK